MMSYILHSDLMENPLIVPVKVLRGHRPFNGLGMTHNYTIIHCIHLYYNITTHPGVLQIVFHPHQPWLISAGADSTLRLYT